jgi:hypothetical protein
MMWWFLILAFGIVAVLWVGAALYLRVRRHMKPESAPRETNEHER